MKSPEYQSRHSMPGPRGIALTQNNSITNENKNRIRYHSGNVTSMEMASERYPLSYGWPKSDTSSTAVWVRAAGADIARFGEARPLLPAWLPPMTEAIRQASGSGGVVTLPLRDLKQDQVPVDSLDLFPGLAESAGRVDSVVSDFELLFDRHLRGDPGLCFFQRQPTPPQEPVELERRLAVARQRACRNSDRNPFRPSGRRR